jgi:hypothetical protein
MYKDQAAMPGFGATKQRSTEGAAHQRILFNIGIRAELCVRVYLNPGFMMIAVPG